MTTKRLLYYMVPDIKHKIDELYSLPPSDPEELERWVLLCRGKEREIFEESSHSDEEIISWAQKKWNSVLTFQTSLPVATDKKQRRLFILENSPTEEELKDHLDLFEALMMAFKGKMHNTREKKKKLVELVDDEKIVPNTKNKKRKKSPPSEKEEAN